MSAKVIVIGHIKGGVGKTTTAISIASELAKTNKVLCIDLDTYKAFTTFCNRRKNAGYGELSVVSPKNADEVKKLINSFDGVIVVDLGGFDSAEGRMAMLGADVLIVPVGATQIELDGFVSMCNTTIADIRKSRKGLKASILFTRVHQFATEKSLGQLFEWVRGKDGLEVLPAIIRTRKEHERTYELGKSAIEMGGKAAEEFADILNFIQGRLDNGGN